MCERGSNVNVCVSCLREPSVVVDYSGETRSNDA